MKLYGFKSSIFGKAFRSENKNRQRNYYDALMRAGRKRERQSGKKNCSEEAVG